MELKRLLADHTGDQTVFLEESTLRGLNRSGELARVRQTRPEHTATVAQTTVAARATRIRGDTTRALNEPTAVERGAGFGLSHARRELVEVTHDNVIVNAETTTRRERQVVLDAVFHDRRERAGLQFRVIAEVVAQHTARDQRTAVRTTATI